MLVLPHFTFAAEQTINSIIQILIYFFSDIIVLAGVGAVAAFFWGTALFIWNTNDAKKLDQGKQWMFWSVIALFCMITIWGLLGFLMDSFLIPPHILPPLQGQ